MAARRLLIIMVVLLTISTLAAALVPPPERRSGTPTASTSTTTTTQRDELGEGELRRARVTAAPAGDEEQRIDVELGDQLSLVVTSTRPGEASLPGFGLIEFAGPGDPARFDVLTEKKGRYPVRFRGKTVATLVVTMGKR